MNIKNRSISKGVIEAKDKQDLVKSQQLQQISQNSQHFSPNVSKRNVGVNLNTFLNSKPGIINSKEEIDLGISDSQYRNTNYNINFLPNQSMNANNSNITNMSNVNSTNYQKYAKNTTINLAKSQIMTDKGGSQISGLNSSIVTNNLVNNTNNNLSNLNQLPQKNMKLESIKNINTVIRKLKTNNTNSKMISGGPSTKPDIQKMGTGVNYQKKQGIPSIQSTSISNISITKKISGNLNSSNYPGQLLPQNLVEISPSNSISNVNLNDIYSNSKTQNNSQSNLSSSTNTKNNFYASGLTHNFNNNQVNLTSNLIDGGTFSSKISNNIYSNNNSAQKNLFKPHIDEVSMIKQKQNNSGMVDQVVFDKTSDNNKKSMQETKDNSSNSSTIKNNKHSNSNSLNTMQVQLNNQLNQSTNIENPEDLHFFYVKMLQTNKEFAYKFEKDEGETQT